MNVKEFEKRAKYNGGYDRRFGMWKVIDVHLIPDCITEQHETDFYCCNGNAVYLLRLRKRQTERYELLPPAAGTDQLAYLIAEFAITNIDDNVLQSVLAKFNLE